MSYVPVLLVLLFSAGLKATPKNIAKESAISFGRANIIDSVEDASKGTDASDYVLLSSLESSVVVSTTSTHTEPSTKTNENDLRTRPRGFFADQFEVSATPRAARART